MNIKDITKEKACAELQNNVYAACSLYEALENNDRITGNGHHMAQEVSEFAKKLLLKQWQSGA